MDLCVTPNNQKLSKLEDRQMKNERKNLNPCEVYAVALLCCGRHFDSINLDLLVSLVKGHCT